MMVNGQLEIYTFGRLAFRYGDQTWQQFRSDKSRGLLLYLALTKAHTQRRDVLVTLFWPEATTAAGRSNLRVALHDLRQRWKKLTGRPAADLFTANRKTVTLNADIIWCDALQLRQVVEQMQQHEHGELTQCATCIEKLSAAIDLMQGEWVPGFTFPIADEFNQWLFFRREELLQQTVHALEMVIAYHQAQRQSAETVTYLRQLLALDGWRETAWQQLFAALAAQGNFAGVEDAYAECRQFLEIQLGIAPAPETVAAYERAREKTADQPTTFSLPIHLTPFFGRSAEFTRLSQLTKKHRLVSLVGAGGVGKSRLATEFARQQHGRFADGVYFVSLVEIGRGAEEAVSEQICIAVANELNLELNPQASAEAQLRQHIETKSVLLLLDNWEHLINASAVASRIVRHAPNVVLLCTSREPLRESAEHVLRLYGLSRRASHGEQPDSVRLFLSRAEQRGQPFDHRDLSTISEICQLVRGVPLAIELAAAWVEHYTLPEIAQEIKNGIDFLDDGGDGRHASMRQLFMQSWQLLNNAQRRTLSALAVFHGTIERDAARAIADANPRLLAALVDKSLLRMLSPGQYRLHAMVREFSAEMQSDPPALHRAHATYFANLLTDHIPSSHFAPFPNAAHAILKRLPDLQAMWQWATATADIPLIEQIVSPLFVLYYRTGRFRQGKTLLETGNARLQTQFGIAMTQEQEIVIAKIATRLARFQSYCGDLTTAYATCTAALTTLQRFNLPNERLLAHLEMVDLHYHFGEFDKALEYATEQMRLAQLLEEPSAFSSACNTLGRVHNMLGNFDAADYYYQKSAALDRANNDQHGLAIKLGNLGRNAMSQGNRTQARRYLEESLTIRKQIAAPHRIASVQYVLGMLAIAEGNYAAAQTLHEEAIVGYTASNRLEAISLCYFGIGMAALGLNDFDTAKRQLQACLQDSLERGLTIRALQAVNGWADYCIALGETQRGVLLKQYVTNHTGSHGDTRKAALVYLEEHGQRSDVMVAKTWQELVSELLMADLSGA